MQSKFLLNALLAVVLAGCATTQPNSVKPDYQESLYEGRSTVTFATQLPVASPEEGELRGDNALRDGDQDRALFEYIRVLELEDKNPRVLFKIGQIHVGRNNTRAAEIAFRWALALDESHVAAHEALGLILLNKREYEPAKQHLSRAVELGQQLWRAHNGLGIIADLENDHRKASAHYEAALAVLPRSPMLLNNLGYSRYLGGDWDGALEVFGRALSYDRGFERAWRNLGLLYARKGDHQRALEAFERVMAPAAAYNNLGYICMNDGKHELAESYFRQAIRTSPTYYVAAQENLNRAVALRAQRTQQ